MSCSHSSWSDSVALVYFCFHQSIKNWTMRPAPTFIKKAVIMSSMTFTTFPVGFGGYEKHYTTKQKNCKEWLNHNPLKILTDLLICDILMTRNSRCEHRVHGENESRSPEQRPDERFSLCSNSNDSIHLGASRTWLLLSIVPPVQYKLNYKTGTNLYQQRCEQVVHGFHHLSSRFRWLRKALYYKTKELQSVTQNQNEQKSPAGTATRQAVYFFSKKT